MLRATLRRREFYDQLASTVRRILSKTVRGIVVFGSSVYMGEGRDVDVLVVIDEEIGVKRRLKLEHEISRELSRCFGSLVFDVHVMSIEEFEENLVPGSFLSGLALGYVVAYDDAGIEEKILRFLEALSKEKYVLHNKYGSWDLGFHAAVLLKARKRKRVAKGHE